MLEEIEYRPKHEPDLELLVVLQTKGKENAQKTCSRESAELEGDAESQPVCAELASSY